MQKSIFFIIAVFGLLLFLPEVSFSQSVDEIIKKADELQNIVSADAEHEALIKILKEAAAKSPDSFDLQWRTARALGIWADQINLRNTLDNAKKTIEKDKAYNDGSPFRVYGRYYYKVPWPYNDKTASEKILREAAQVYPTSLRTLLYLGDTLYALGKRDEAKRQWEKIIKTSASAMEKVLEDVFKGMAKMRLERVSN